MSDYEVQADEETLEVTVYRPIFGGGHRVCIQSSDGSTHYLAPDDARHLATLLTASANEADVREQDEQASRV